MYKVKFLERKLEIHNLYILRSKILWSLFRLPGWDDGTEGGYTRFTIVLGLEGVSGSFIFSGMNALGVADFATTLNGVTNFGLVAFACLGVKPNGF